MLVKVVKLDEVGVPARMKTGKSYQDNDLKLLPSSAKRSGEDERRCARISIVACLELLSA